MEGRASKAMQRYDANKNSSNNPCRLLEEFIAVGTDIRAVSITRPVQIQSWPRTDYQRPASSSRSIITKTSHSVLTASLYDFTADWRSPGAPCSRAKRIRPRLHLPDLRYGGRTSNQSEPCSGCAAIRPCTGIDSTPDQLRLQGQAICKVSR